MIRGNGQVWTWEWIVEGEGGHAVPEQMPQNIAGLPLREASNVTDI